VRKGASVPDDPVADMLLLAEPAPVKVEAM
jgi:hypothetical protein